MYTDCHMAFSISMLTYTIHTVLAHFHLKLLFSREKLTKVKTLHFTMMRELLLPVSVIETLYLNCLPIEYARGHFLILRGLYQTTVSVRL